MDYKDFTAIQQALAVASPNPRQSYSKVKEATPEEYKRCMEDQLKRLHDKEATPASSTLVPKLRDAGYLSRCCPPGVKVQLPANLPFDAAGVFSFVVFQRQAKALGNGRFLNSDGLSLHKLSDEQPPRKAAGSQEAACAFRNVAALDSNLTYDLQQGELLRVSAAVDELATSRLALPSFVQTMRRKLNCTAKDHLVVVPWATNIVYAARSSSPLGCCMLGDMTDAADASEDELREHLTSTPFRVASMDTSRPAQELMAQGMAPVVWEPYPHHGAKPLHGFADAEGKVLFPVPGSAKQAVEFLADLKAGAKPTVIALAIDDGVKGVLTGSCGSCLAFGTFAKCSRCHQICYCSKACQKAHWPEHKLKCKQKA